MNLIPKISLEQWATFKAVVDEGSYAAAAEVLNKSQSTVSYSISKMEERLPSPVFEQQGRKSSLTEFGRSLYRHASHLLEQALRVDQTADYLASGWESEVVLAVDAIAPLPHVFCGLQNFSLENPGTRVKLLETTLSGTDESLLRREADIVITARVPPGFLADYYGVIHRVPVASPNHPLFDEPVPISEEVLKNHRQIVVRDSGIQREQDAGWLGSEQRWTVSHFSSSIDAVKAGLGFAFIPQEKIRHELGVGLLKVLPVVSGLSQPVTLFVVMASQSHAGPATKCIVQHLLKHNDWQVG